MRLGEDALFCECGEYKCECIVDGLIYPDDYINKVICGDCLEVMKGIPDKSIDLVLTDPPYGIGLKYGNYEDTEDNWFKLFNSMLPEILRISTMAILPSCRIKALPYIYQKFPPDWLICWYKGSTGHRAFVGFNDWEPLLVYGKGQGVQMHDYFNIQSQRFDSITSQHPCPKPLKWASWLISRATQKDQIVLDPFLGSGTTAVACKELGRKFIGIEINKEYCQIAERRLAQEVFKI